LPGWEFDKVDLKIQPGQAAEILILEPVRKNAAERMEPATRIQMNRRKKGRPIRSQVWHRDLEGRRLLWPVNTTSDGGDGSQFFSVRGARSAL
jgi:hypothetical protein